MKRRTKFLLVGLLGLQLYSTPLMIAEPATLMGNEEFSQSQAALLLDSLHTQEPPGIKTMVDTVIASYYGRRFHGRKTANGETFDRFALTCAHKTLPFNTVLKVTNPKNDKSVIVRVNDRGPFKKKRQLDLSYSAAKEIGMIKRGVIPVIIEILPDGSQENSLVKGNTLLHKDI